MQCATDSPATAVGPRLGRGPSGEIRYKASKYEETPKVSTVYSQDSVHCCTMRARNYCHGRGDGPNAARRVCCLL